MYKAFQYYSADYFTSLLLLSLLEKLCLFLKDYFHHSYKLLIVLVFAVTF